MQMLAANSCLLGTDLLMKLRLIPSTIGLHMDIPDGINGYAYGYGFKLNQGLSITLESLFSYGLRCVYGVS